MRAYLQCFFIASDVFNSFHHTFVKYSIRYIYCIYSFIHILVLSKEMATSSDSTTDLTSEISGISLTENDLSDLIKIQGDIVRKLKAEKAPKEQVCNLLLN